MVFHAYWWNYVPVTGDSENNEAGGRQENPRTSQAKPWRFEFAGDCFNPRGVAMVDGLLPYDVG